MKYAETYVHVYLEINGTGENKMFYIRSVNDGVIIPNEMKEEIFKPFVRFNEKEDGKSYYRNRNWIGSFAFIG